METSNILFTQMEGKLVSSMNEEKVMMSIENGKYYNLGRVGGRIWELVEQPHTIRSIADQLVSEYEIDRETCENQVTSFVLRMLNEGLLKVETISS